MTRIEISRIHFPVTTLGPGRRVGVWFQGCSIRCTGCISPDTWTSGERWTDVATLADALAAWAPRADGLTISGGEPFDQPEGLAALLETWRRLSKTDILVFTGYPFRSVASWLDVHAGSIDALLAGPFLERAAQTLALRGSDNQTLHLLTQAGQKAFCSFERRAEFADRRLDMMFDSDGGVWFAGIPARGDFDRLTRALSAAGHVVVTDRTLRA